MPLTGVDGNVSITKNDGEDGGVGEEALETGVLAAETTLAMIGVVVNFFAEGVVATFGGWTQF